MKALLRLYPRSWRDRYGREMEVLVEDLPLELGTALDLLVGAAAAYATVIHGNRILSTAGAYLHGVCVAVLLQAIAFVTLILLAQGRITTTDVLVGPIHLATFSRPFFFGGRSLSQALISALPVEWLPAIGILAALVAALALVVASPRLVKASR